MLADTSVGELWEYNRNDVCFFVTTAEHVRNILTDGIKLKVGHHEQSAVTNKGLRLSNAAETAFRIGCGSRGPGDKVVYVVVKCTLQPGLSIVVASQASPLLHTWQDKGHDGAVFLWGVNRYNYEEFVIGNPANVNVVSFEFTNARHAREQGWEQLSVFPWIEHPQLGYKALIAKRDAAAAAAAACYLGSAVESTAPVTALHVRLMRCGLLAVR